MGNSESSANAGGGTNEDFDGVETLGYRVLGVQPNSPASAAGLVSFFDFLIGADGRMLLGSGEELEEGEEYDDIDFPALLEKFKGKPLQLLVWNIKCQEKRLVDIVPSDDWEGAGLLGVTIRLDNYGGAEDRLIRILTAETNSPAAIAGLVPEQDYLLGTTTHSFDSTKVLAAVLETHVDKVVELYVFNTNSDKVRVVALMPTWSWGGNGLLGAECGTGYLHRLPGSCRTTLGGSVERKVRWVGGGKNGPTSPQLQQVAALELEPQLEMEPNEEEEEEEQSVGTVSLASQMSAIPDSNGSSSRFEPTAHANDTQTPETNNIAPAPEENTSSSPPAEATTSDGPVNPDAEQVEEIAAQAPGEEQAEVSHPPIIRNDSGKSYQTHYQSSQPTGRPVSAPAPYVMHNSMPGTPGEQSVVSPVNMTTFIPAAKPPDGQNVSAQDLFSGPPPVAKIPSKSNLDFGTPDRSAPRRSGSGASVSSVRSNGYSEHSFSTPQPLSAIRPPPTENDNGGATSPPIPPVAAVEGVGMMPPPPRMSGAHI